MSEIIPSPVTFNPYKHHFRFLKGRIAEWKIKGPGMFVPEIDTIGNNLIDFYLGELNVAKISNECLCFLDEQNKLEINCYVNWLKPLGYKKAELSDQSIWVFREGTNPERYVHIHPAKQSPHTLRIRSATLKTVLAARVVLNPGQKVTLEEINRIRKNYLQLSPVKSIQSEKGILKIWQLFNTR